MFLVVPLDKDERGYLTEKVNGPLSQRKDKGEVKLFEIHCEQEDRPVIEEVDEEGNTEELPMKW